MAEEDNEVLDWGNEDDVVSLGDEDERLTLEDPVLVAQNGLTDALPGPDAPAAPTRSLSMSPMEEVPLAQTPDRKAAAPTPEPSKPPPTPSSQSSHKLAVPLRLTHALPPKPIAANMPYVPPSDPTIVEATAMASRSNKKVDTSGHELKDGSRHDHIGPLPPQWEIRFSRDRPNEFYYYDLRFKLSTWDRPSASTPSATDPPAPLSHDDRHYRPDNRHSAGPARRYEGDGDSSESRQNRQHSGTTGRSPARGYDRSRSHSPQGKDSRPRGNQHPTRRGNKSNGPQKDSTTSSAPKNDDRHWVPSPPSAAQHLSRSARRQLNRAQNQSKDDRAVDAQLEEVSHGAPDKEASGKDHNRDRDRTYASDHASNNIPTNSTTRPIPPPPPPKDEPIIIYQTKVEPRRERQVSPERPRSPGPSSDPNLPSQIRRERPSRFGPGAERANGLPAKPVTAPFVSSADFVHQKEAQPERRVEPDRQFGGPVSQHSPSTNRSPVQTRAPEPPFTHSSNGNRERKSPVRSENRPPAPSRKRQPLPPQDKEFREAGRVRSVHPEASAQRSNHPPPSRSPPPTFQGREKAESEIDAPPQHHGLHRSYSGRGDSRDVGHNQLPPGPRDAVPEYDRGYEQDRPRVRQHGSDQMDQDRNFGMAVDTPLLAHDGRLGYQDRERDPPSKPRAMHQDSTPPAYVSAGPSNTAPPQSSSRYRDRPSPPHLSRPESRQDIDTRPGPPPPGPWQERREERRTEKPYIHSDRPMAREPRGRQAPTSSVNSIPIGRRRTYTGLGSPTSTANAVNDRFERQPYPVNDPPQVINNDQEYPRPYQQESVAEAWPGYSRPREDSYAQTPIDDRSHGAGKANLPLNPATLPNQPANTSRQQRQSRFSTPRNSHLEREQPPDRPSQQKAWSNEYNMSSHGRFNDSTRNATPPPMSREPSFTSPNWTPPSPSLHEPSSRVMDYPDAPGLHKPLIPTSRIDIDLVPTRQAPPVSIPRDVPAQHAQERYNHRETVFSGSGLPRPPQPPARADNRRDASSYSPEARRAPAQHVTTNGMERGGNGRKKLDKAGIPADESTHNGRRLLNERISELPPPPTGMQARGGRKQPQGIRQDNGYNHGEPDPPEVRAFGRMDLRQDNHPPQPAKTFEQRLDSMDGASIPRGGSLLSRISHGSNNVLPSSQSLRDRVQTGNKRDREDMARSHLPDGPVDADDGDLDGGNRRRKRRRARRGGGP